MFKCLVCGKEGNVICDSCLKKTDLPALYDELRTYAFGTGKNEKFEAAMKAYDKAWSMMRREYMCLLAENMEFPKNCYYSILSQVKYELESGSRNYLYKKYSDLVNSDEFTKSEIIFLKGLMMNACFWDFKFQEAEELAEELSVCKDIGLHECLFLADYYTKTRRYEKANATLEKAEKLDGKDWLVEKRKQIAEKYNYYVSTKKHYTPKRSERANLYFDALNSIGVHTQKPMTKKDKMQQKIPASEYPAIPETHKLDTDSFIVFDLETTGLSPAYDEIIEIAAVKIEKGKITSDFSSLVKPLKKNVSYEASELTGITQKDLINEKNIWDVFPEFMNFAGNNILVGWNCAKFDGKFLKRAGRYSRIIIKNKLFDAMKYAKKLGYSECSLESICEKLEVTNKNKHRALEDAYATAKVVLKLLEDNGEKSTDSLDALLSDIN